MNNGSLGAFLRLNDLATLVRPSARVVDLVTGPLRAVLTCPVDSLVCASYHARRVTRNKGVK